MKVQHYAGLVFFGVTLSSFAMEENHLPAYLHAPISSNDKLYRAIFNDAPQEIEAIAKSVDIVDSRCVISRDSNRMPPLWWALSLARPKAVRALLALGVNSNAPRTNALLSASKPATVQVNSRGGQIIISRAESCIKPVHYAAFNGDMQSTLALIQADADVSGDIISSEVHSDKPVRRDVMGYALKYYVEDEETAHQVVTELFAKGYCMANNHRSTNIWFAAIYNPIGRYPLNKRLLDLLIAQKADVNDHFDYGAVRVTPLGYAIQAGAIDAVALLLEAGARVDEQIKRKNEPSRTLLEFARERVMDQRPNAGGVLQLLQERVSKK